MIEITKEINPKLLLEELEALGSVEIINGERFTRTRLTKTKDGYILHDAPVGAELVILAHDPRGVSKQEDELEKKKGRKDVILRKLGITAAELAELLS